MTHGFYIYLRNPELSVACVSWSLRELTWSFVCTRFYKTMKIINILSVMYVSLPTDGVSRQCMYIFFYSAVQICCKLSVVLLSEISTLVYPMFVGLNAWFVEFYGILQIWLILRKITELAGFHKIPHSQNSNPQNSAFPIFAEDVWWSFRKFRIILVIVLRRVLV